MTIPKVILTHGRSSRVLTLNWLPGAALCVSKSQEPLYREHYPDQEYIVHPDDVVGLLPKRNWLYEKIGDSFQLADDVKVMMSVFTGAGEKPITPTGDYAESLIDRLADEARELGVYLFGFSSTASPISYNVHAPYRLTGLVYGQAFGWLAGSKLFYSNKIKVAGDYWLSCLNAYHHRTVLIDGRWALVTTDMFAGRGPISSIRTTAAEGADNDTLQRTFGEEIVRIKRQGKGPAAVNLKMSTQRTLRIPF